MTMRNAECAVPGCAAGIPATHLMCRPHWRALPACVRAEVQDSYTQLRRGDCSGDVLAAVARYRLARRAAIDHYRQSRIHALEAPAMKRRAAIAGVLLAAVTAAVVMGAAAQELAPKSHDVPKPPAPPGALPDAGGAPFADVRGRVPMDPTGREFRQDQLEDRDVLYNLQLFFHKGSPPGRIACPDGGEPTRLSAVVLEGVHQHEQALRFTADTRAAGAVHTSILFLRAIAYYRGHGLDGRCAGRELRGAVELVRLTDGAWFAPEWRRTLVKRR